MLRQVSFFTALRIHEGDQDQPLAAPDLRRYPFNIILAGLVPALGSIAVAFAVLDLFGDPLLSGLLAVATTIITTGALHEDGLADAADGWFGGRESDDVIRIMHDKSLGAYGVLALLFVVGAKISLYGQLLLSMPLPQVVGIATAITFPALVSRAVMITLAIGFPIAGHSKLAKILLPNHAKSDDGLSVSTSIMRLWITMTVLTVFASMVSDPGTVFLALTSAILTGAIFACLVPGRLGGFTGDLLGASQQLSELSALMCFLLLPELY